MTRNAIRANEEKRKRDFVSETRVKKIRELNIIGHNHQNISNISKYFEILATIVRTLKKLQKDRAFRRMIAVRFALSAVYYPGCC